ncbi:MAG: hypothetical protein ABL973_18660 [Micropepsaceae bacterium]
MAPVRTALLIAAVRTGRRRWGNYAYANIVIPANAGTQKRQGEAHGVPESLTATLANQLLRS